MIQILITIIVFIISTILLVYFSDIGIICFGVVPILYLVCVLSTYVIGYKQCITDTKIVLKEQLITEIKKRDDELKRLSEGIDSGLL